MRLSEAKPTKHETDVFKALHAAGPSVTNGSTIVLAKRAVMPRQMVMAKDHAVIGPLYRQLMGELDLAKRNSHGAVTGAEAFGPRSHVHTDPPSRHDVTTAQVPRKKKKVIPKSGHHGAAPAGKETYAIGTPRTTELKDAATHAPGHETYFHEPAHQPTMQTEPSKAAGGSDAFRKSEDAIRQAQRRPFASPDEI